MTSPDFYTPRQASAWDAALYAKTLADKLMRNNPLVDAQVPSGLTRWAGNYFEPDGDRINVLWVGEFFPADTNLGPTTPQRGFVMQRDDSRGGQLAIVMYDPYPDAGGGLRQVLFFYSGDGIRLMEEAREGGQRWPEDTVELHPIGDDVFSWTRTVSTTWFPLYLGKINVIGNTVEYQMAVATTNGASAEYRMRIEGDVGQPDITGITHVLGVDSAETLDNLFDVTAFRGQTLTIIWEAQRTNGVGEVRTAAITARCHSL